MDTYFEQIKRAHIMIDSLCIFKKLKDDNVLIKYKALLKYLRYDDISVSEGITFYNEFVYELLEESNETNFKKYIIDKIFLDNNAFTKMIDCNDLSQKNIVNQVSFELEALQYICSIECKTIKDLILYKTKGIDFEEGIIKNLIEWDSKKGIDDSEKSIDKLKKKIIDSNKWSECLEDIIEFYKKFGTVEFGEYRAFVWERDGGKAYLRGVKHPDPVKLSQLVGYEDQKKIIINNTLQFLNGHPANNLLLYGSRGTGKSSTVKAIINEYYDKGLRLIEVDKDRLTDFTKIIEVLKDKNLKFIIFVDDLVFQDGEASYSALKTILEGGIESNTNNIIIYATTNRKHLVKETFEERNNDIHASDTVEEKLSLSDRFGITVSFYSPDQKEYLAIVESLVKERNIEVDPEYLRAEALKWVRFYNGRSPRTAKQFVNYLEGNMKIK